MAVSAIGFEGFEKRLEIAFSGPPNGPGLRALTRNQLDSILELACCTIVSHLSNTEFDSYVLSESSLFVYPLKIILKTCGTTKLLLSVPQILKLADSLSLVYRSVRYSRGTFIFQNTQPAPHRSFSEEAAFLNTYFENGSGYLLGDPSCPNRNWHVYVAAVDPDPLRGSDYMTGVNLEMCMTGLDREKAAVFFNSGGGGGGGRMTKMSGIDDILPGHEICDFEFEPCGYSMNAIEGAAYSTVHVTPEDGFSYASYEAMGLELGSVGFEPLLKRVLRCFKPEEFSLAVTCQRGGGLENIWFGDVDGYTCENAVVQPLPGGGWVVYRCFAAEERRCVATTTANSAMHCWKEVAEEGRLTAVRCVDFF
ncbi:hypothetical protein ABFS82_10G128900 [Erythranthe guttata]|uniref:S-adenosylmethionine decarboxylase proenzyme n=1 Tax=Erythranthe guttata TaxID=4155 RepID=A0A022RE09_ERYGU|nr:PREDICTED: S-adenosylmethionine decarboxylase proenzyme-like [Erythranthe guttata]XP_012837851.1 PREDICTED: S-adenosylmethionine decarboxylase proenzyme-like [Erythranthe guttata]EYU37130.1 hypothetical protein MIMGU_mgv1a008734mg [Erythranthe guttata]|eukprot:XP_012837850.1 PREDICTED: S-adenosylmethionine decarboxylase proenzyme-like [Erythranthe guttata]